MPHNEDNDLRDDHRHSSLTAASQMPPPSSLLGSAPTLDQLASSNDGGPAHMRYTSHWFI